jgi:hypothetical protein
MTGAILSPCGRFRYQLWRYWGDRGRPLVFIMLNPSTADAHANDPTIRKCIGFAKRLGYDGIEVFNLFAYRATAPADLVRAGYPVGIQNDLYLHYAAVLCATHKSPAVCAWGANARGLSRAFDVREILLANGAELGALRILADGTPAHPLMLPYSETIKPL